MSVSCLGRVRDSDEFARALRGMTLLSARGSEMSARFNAVEP